MQHYLLFYEVVPDYAARRMPLRAEHLAYGRAAQQRRANNPIDGAVLLFQGDSPAVAEEFARSDPY